MREVNDVGSLVSEIHARGMMASVGALYPLRVILPRFQYKKGKCMKARKGLEIYKPKKYSKIKFIQEKKPLRNLNIKACFNNFYTLLSSTMFYY